MRVVHWRPPSPHTPRLPVFVAVWQFPDSMFQVGARYITSDGEVGDRGGTTMTCGSEYLLAESDYGECFVISVGTLHDFYPEWAPVS